MEDLAREVPVVERLGGVDALVALQPDQRQVERLGERLGQRGLAGAGLPLEQQRALHREREVGDRGELVVAQVPGPARAGRHVGGRVTCVLSMPPGYWRLVGSLVGWSDGRPCAGEDVGSSDGPLMRSVAGSRRRGRWRGRRTRRARPVGGEVVAGALVADGRLDHPGPVVAAEEDRVPGFPSYDARASAAGPSPAAITRRPPRGPGRAGRPATPRPRRRPSRRATAARPAARHPSPRPSRRPPRP